MVAAKLRAVMVVVALSLVAADAHAQSAIPLGISTDLVSPGSIAPLLFAVPQNLDNPAPALDLGDSTTTGSGHRSASVGDWVHAVCMMAFSLGTLGYWLDFYTTGDVRTGADQAYIDFESSFVLADTYLAVSYTTSAVLLLLQEPIAVPIGIAAGSASIYLGCMDLLYDLEHNKFSDFSASMAFETFIIAASFGLGGVTIVRFWQALDRLEKGQAQ